SAGAAAHLEVVKSDVERRAQGLAGRLLCRKATGQRLSAVGALRKVVALALGQHARPELVPEALQRTTQPFDRSHIDAETKDHAAESTCPGYLGNSGSPGDSSGASFCPSPWIDARPGLASGSRPREPHPWRR